MYKKINKISKSNNKIWWTNNKVDLQIKFYKTNNVNILLKLIFYKKNISNLLIFYLTSLCFNY